MIIHQGKYIRVISKDGWEFVERTHSQEAVVILAKTEDEKVILIEQFRVPLNAWVIEFPAGLLKDPEAPADENVEDAARRELLEETGYEAHHMERVIAGPPSPGLSNEVAIFYRARSLEKKTEGGGVGGEKITVHTVPIQTVDLWLGEMEKKGCWIDPKVFAGLYFLARP